MRFLTFSSGSDDKARLGLAVDDTSLIDLVLALAGTVTVPPTLQEYIAAGPVLHNAVHQAIAETGTWPENIRYRLDEITLHAPLRPGKVIGVGLNYVDHVAESSRSLDTDRELPSRPVLFGMPATAVIGSGEPIQHNATLTSQLDWECELAVVIGKTARSVTESEAFDHVFGYAILNDISARDQRRSGQWFFSKGQDSFAPLGPAVVTADEIPDPHDLALALFVNGQQRQNGNTRDMLFKIPQLIADISSAMTLEPGDVISTGSPQGVGAAMTPPQFLTPGDVVEARIESVGTLINTVKAV
jgi:2-keto-4-pentenoate hydratase/2-oxohepta-3-ene-1,7-dioic acid hydratase in catechol pathway